METDTNLFLIVDASNITHRAWYATMANPEIKNPEAMAHKTLVRMTHNLLRECGDPLRRAVALDRGKTFRHRLYPEYKAHRTEKAEGLADFAAQTPDFFRSEGFELYFSPDHEADDVIATIADANLPYGWRTVISSNDKDLLQLVIGDGPGPGTFVLQHEKGRYSSMGVRAVTEKMGVPPRRVALFKAVMGDSSDNILGIPDMGPVAAKRLALTYRNMWQVWEGRKALMKSDRTKIEAAGLDHLLLMESLTTLNHKAPISAA